jgi:hypothetical protein
MSAEDAPDPADRLEAALERIGLAARAVTALPRPAAHGTTQTDTEAGAQIVARLDALIADLRSVLGTQV